MGDSKQLEASLYASSVDGDAGDDIDDEKVESHAVYIVVMGMTGAGKSTFIHQLTNDPGIVLSDSLISGTKEIYVSKFTQDRREINLVDTPGFDDTQMEDIKILESLATFLKRINAKISGVIYIHPITQGRVYGTTMLNFDLMKKLVGEDPNTMEKLMLVTNRWEEDQHPREEYETREKQFLDSKDGFFSECITGGASYNRYDGTAQRAKEIIRQILDNKKTGPEYLQYQVELRQGKSVEQTKAGEALLEKMGGDMSTMKKTLKSLMNQNNKLLGQNRELIKQNTEVLGKLENHHKALDGLNAEVKDQIGQLEDKIDRMQSCCIIL